MKIYTGICMQCHNIYDVWGDADKVGIVFRFMTRQHMVTLGHWIVSEERDKPWYLPVRLCALFQAMSLILKYRIGK